MALADKFAGKEDIQLQTFFEEFKRKFRAILNELEGDYMTLRIKEYDRSSLQILGKLYHNLLEIFKKINDSEPFESVHHFIRFVFNHSTRKTIQSLDDHIQKWLKENEVDFSPGSSMRQARVDSLKLLLRFAASANEKISAIKPDASYERESDPVGGPADATRVFTTKVSPVGEH